jgi:hypothetical protein
MQMTATPDNRVQDQINAERAFLSDLNSRVGADLKKEVLEVSDLLTDAERWLAPPRVPCSETELASRRASAVQCLREAFKHRKRIEALAKKIGPNARVVVC